MTSITDPKDIGWLDAIAKHPKTADRHILAACELLLGEDFGPEAFDPGYAPLTEYERGVLVGELAALGFVR